MNREQAEELIPILEAYVRGEELQERITGGEWGEQTGAFIIAGDYEHRIKPTRREYWIDLRTNQAYCNQSFAEDNSNAGREGILHVREVLE